MEDSCDLLPVIFTDSVFLPQLIWFWFRIYFEDRAVWKKAQLELVFFLCVARLTFWLSLRVFVYLTPFVYLSVYLAYILNRKPLR